MEGTVVGGTPGSTLMQAPAAISASSSSNPGTGSPASAKPSASSPRQSLCLGLHSQLDMSSSDDDDDVSMASLRRKLRESAVTKNDNNNRTTSSFNQTKNHLKQMQEDGFSSTASTGKTASMSGPPGGGDEEEKSPTSPASLPREIVTRTNIMPRESLGTPGDPIALDDSSSSDEDEEQQDTQAAANSELEARRVDKKGSKGVSIDGDKPARPERAVRSQKDKADRDQRGLETRETKDKLLEVGSPVYAPWPSNQPDQHYYWGTITAKIENQHGKAIFNITFSDGDELNGVGSDYIHRMKEAFQLKERETVEVVEAPKEYFNLWRPEDGPPPDWNHFEGLSAGETPKEASPKQQQSDGPFRRPKGRAPLGKMWDECKGVWVEETTSKKRAASPMENSVTRKYAGSGTLQKATTKQTYITSTFNIRQKDGTYCQPTGQPVVEKTSKKRAASPMENSVTRKDADSGTLQETATNQIVPRQSLRQRPNKRRRLADDPLIGMPYRREWIRANFQRVSIAGSITEEDDITGEYSITYSPASLEMLKSGISGAPGVLPEPEVKVGIDMVWDGCLRACGENLPEELVEIKPDTIERWLVPSTIVPDMIVADDIQIPGFLYLPVLRLTYNGYCLKLRVGKSSIEGARFGLFLSVMKEFDSDHCEDDFILHPGELIDLGVYTPLRVEDVKSNIEFLVKTLIHKFKPEVFVYETDRKETSSEEAYFDATDDQTGDLHMLARRRVYPFVNEIADPKTELPIITSRMDPEGALHYLLGPSHERAKCLPFKVAADGSEREVFTDYEDLYEDMRILEGYPRLTLDSKEARDEQLLKMECEYVQTISGKCAAEDILRVVRTYRPFMSPTYDMPKDTVVRTIAIFVLMKHISCRLLSQCNDRGNRSQLDDLNKECDSGIQEGSECLKLQHGTGVNLLHEARQSSLFKCIFERVHPRYQLSSLDETAFTGLLLSTTY